MTTVTAQALRQLQ